MRRAFLLLLLATSLTACGMLDALNPAADERPADGLLRFEGTVTYTPLEGGFWGLAAADGTRYEPINLDAAYRREGLRVRVEAKPRPDLMSTRMAGPIIEIRTIKTL